MKKTVYISREKNGRACDSGAAGYFFDVSFLTSSEIRSS